jgi:hypothetical protein
MPARPGLIRSGLEATAGATPAENETASRLPESPVAECPDQFSAEKQEPVDWLNVMPFLPPAAQGQKCQMPKTGGRFTFRFGIWLC